MTRDQILTDIKQQCTQEYQKVDNWVHDIHHIERVVKNSRHICEMEGVKPKTAFLVELACWLHDLGRVDEEIGLLFGKSRHAEISYQKSKLLIKPYERFLGRESVYAVLEAVREHSLGSLRHPHNRVAGILVDADRGAGLNAIGIYSMLVYLKTVEFEPVTTIKQAVSQLPVLTQILTSQGKIEEAIEQLKIYQSWYEGSADQVFTGKVVSPLHTTSARKLFKPGVEVINKYIEKLETLRDKGMAFSLSFRA